MSDSIFHTKHTSLQEQPHSYDKELSQVQSSLLNSHLCLSSPQKQQQEEQDQQQQQQDLLHSNNSFDSQNISPLIHENVHVDSKDQSENSVPPFVLSMNKRIDWCSFSPQLYLRMSSSKQKQLADNNNSLNSPIRIREFNPLINSINNDHLTIVSLTIADSLNRRQHLQSDFYKQHQLLRNASNQQDQISEFHIQSPNKIQFNPRLEIDVFKKSEQMQVYDINMSRIGTNNSCVLVNFLGQPSQFYSRPNEILNENEVNGFNFSKESIMVEENSSEKKNEQEQLQLNRIFLLPGDFLVDLSPLHEQLSQVKNQSESFSKESNNNDNYDESRKELFFNSEMNRWKQCSFIEKDCAENGCFYLTINNRIGGLSITSPISLRSELDLLQKQKLEIEEQLPYEKVVEFNQLFSRISSQINCLVKLIGDNPFHDRIILNEINQCDQYSKLEQLLLAERQAKAIMKDIVNIHGSNKSFVFGKLITIDALTNTPHTAQHIYSPKLVSILFGLKKRSGQQFVNQILRKGLIDFLGNKSQFMINSLEIAVLSLSLSGSRQQQSRQRNTIKANSKLNLNLRTAEGLTVPITVMIKKYPLNEIIASLDASKNPPHMHFLLVFDIKIKIKYQKQLKHSREKMQGRHNHLLFAQKKENQKEEQQQQQFNPLQNEKQLQPKSVKKVKGQIDLEELKQCFVNNQPSDGSHNYYEKSFNFLNKFYPEAFPIQNS